MAGIVVMDIGKSNVKLSLVNALSGELVSTDTAEFSALEQDPYTQLDTGGIWEWYVQEIGRVQEQTPVSHICVTAHGATAALIDDNALVLPVLDYEHPGPDECMDAYDMLCDPFNETYSPKLPHGLNVGRQLFWQRERFPDLFSQARHLLPYPQYWTWKLTGKPVSEVSTIGSHTDLWFPVERTFSNFALKQGFAQLFPPMLAADQVLGSPAPQFCEQTGVSSSCQVITGIHDSNASLIPYLKTRQAPFTVMSTGTWVIIFAVGAPLESLVAARDCTANVNIYSEPVACARFMGGREFSTVAGNVLSEATIADLERLLDNDVFALPAFAQEGGPFPGHEGHVTPADSLEPAERYALASLYCALVSDESLSLCGSLGEIIVEGAYARNLLLLQCLSVFRSGQSILGSTDSTGTTMGTAMLVTDTVSAPTLISPEPVPDSLKQKLLVYRGRWQQQVCERSDSS